MVKLEFPTWEIVTVSDPDVARDPDQAPEAEHEEALEEDQVKFVSEPIKTSVESAEKLTVGRSDGAGSDPPPPPPPHEKSKKSKVNDENVFIFNTF